MMNGRAGFFVVLLLTYSGGAEGQLCVAPAAPVIVFAPTSPVAVGQTYGIDWSDTAGDGGFYVVERSATARFDDATFEQQYVSASAASFISTAEATYYHRVRAVPACDPSKVSAYSATRTATIVSGAPKIVFTVHPTAVLVAVGESLANLRSPFRIENVSRKPATVAMVTELISASPFFSVVDPEGGDVSRLSLQPGVPKQLEVRYSGPSTSANASHEGIISVRGVSEALATTPHAYVNLKIGASSGTAVPSFRVAGATVEYLSLPAYAVGQPDAARPPFRIEISNASDTPMELGAEISPEAWLVPRAGWNADSIPARSSVQVDLFVNRTRATSTAAFPRYTFLTVRTRGGQSARLMVQDNDAISSRASALPLVTGATQSFLLTRVAAITGSLGRFQTRLRLTNVSSAAVATDIYFIPMGTSGTSSASKASIIVPPNDIVTMSDVLGELFNIGAQPAAGHLEIRTATENARFLTATASTYVVTPEGELSFFLPVILRDEGATQSVKHVVSGLTVSERLRMIVNLVETTRRIDASCTVTLAVFNRQGVKLGEAKIPLGPAMELTIYGLLQIIGGPPILDGGRMEISVQGKGAVSVNVCLLDNFTGGPSSIYVSQPAVAPQIAPLAGAQATTSKTYAILGTVNGPISGRSYSTLLGMAAVNSPVDLDFTYRSPNYVSKVRPRINLPAGQTIELPNVLKDLFQLPTDFVSQGMISVTASSDVYIYGRVMNELAGGPHVAGNLAVISDASEALTSAHAGFQRPVYFDGLEQSVDVTKQRWSLVLSEINGGPAVMTVRLYEAGNRTAPIAEQDVSLRPREQASLNTVFAALGLDTAERRKDRVNVQVVVVPKSGSGAVAAVANRFDAATGDVLRYLLTPNGGVAASGVSKVTAVLPRPPEPARRRSVTP